MKLPLYQRDAFAKRLFGGNLNITPGSTPYPCATVKTLERAGKALEKNIYSLIEADI